MTNQMAYYPIRKWLDSDKLLANRRAFELVTNQRAYQPIRGSVD